MSDVTFVGLEPSDSLREYAERKAATLAQGPELMSCRIVLEANHHSRGGKRFRAKFELETGAAERSRSSASSADEVRRSEKRRRQKIVVGASGEAHEDMYAAIDASFDDAKRALHEHVAKTREARRQA